MELFDNVGFDVGDRVYVVLDDIKYFGTVVKVDYRLNRIKVDYTGKYTKELAVDWFQSSFWSKVKE